MTKSQITKSDNDILLSWGIDPKSARWSCGELLPKYMKKGREWAIKQILFMIDKALRQENKKFVGSLAGLPYSWNVTAVNTYRFIELNLSVYFYLGVKQEKKVFLTGYCKWGYRDETGLALQEESLTEKEFLFRLKKYKISFSYPSSIWKEIPSGFKQEITI